MMKGKMINLVYVILSVFIFSSVGFAGEFREKRKELDQLYDEVDGKSATSDDQTSKVEPTEEKPKKQQVGAPKQQQKQLFGEEVSSDSESKESISHIKKILEDYPGYIEIVNSQIFSDYVNNLSLQQLKNAKRVKESGTKEEAVKLITDYKNQMNYQKEHINMITNIVNNWTGMNRLQRAENIIQDWARKAENNAVVTGLKVKETNLQTGVGDDNAYLIYYTIVRNSSKQEYAYLVDTFNKSVRAVYIDSELRKNYGFY